MARGTASFIGEVNDLRALKRSVIPLLKAHIPSVTDEMDHDEDLWPKDDMGDYIGDQRVCHCGRDIDGYYDYVDHLVEVFVKAGFPKEDKR